MSGKIPCLVNRRPAIAAKKILNESLSQTELHKYNNIVESINKRTLLLKQPGTYDSTLTDIMHTTLGGSPFAGMKDSVMGEFMHYVGNNFGKERLNKIVKNFAAAGDSGSLQQFIGKKLKGFMRSKEKRHFTSPLSITCSAMTLMAPGTV